MDEFINIVIFIIGWKSSSGSEDASERRVRCVARGARGRANLGLRRRYVYINEEEKVAIPKAGSKTGEW